MRKLDIGIIAAIIIILYFLFHSKSIAVTNACIVGAPVTGGGCGNTQPAANNPLMFTPDATSVQSNPGAPSVCGIAQSVVQSGQRINYCIDPSNGSSWVSDSLPDPNIPVQFLSDPKLIQLSEDLNAVPTSFRQTPSGV